ncbi:uncharacterized protein DNG_04909 [Cephalotrichum gorgonifer]|uniref:RING-type domain-containing protein n=1 Tax=Cephalotrichum gorgonifer TaxID=2041049 RepID=A0AAE8SV14_9PEZI|nr:uncharacterized protein DNG_04909 [Cephalotrichum gorgonifer]
MSGYSMPATMDADNDLVSLMLSNPAWYEGTTVSNTVIRNITALSSELAYDEGISQNLTTLTTTNAETRNGVIHGLLYVPTISDDNPCSEDQYDPSIGLPRNVTKRANLPPANYKLVALAPWFSKNCTKAYLRAARFDPVRAFIFYRPNNSTNKPQDVEEPIWDLDDGGAWVNENKFPIFAIPGRDGKKMAAKLAEYSGSVDQVPYGEDILDAFGPNPRDYVRIWTQLTMEDKDDIPALWTFFVIVIGALLGIIACVSLSMHLIQRRRRKSLAARVRNREVDLEALGIARVTVPSQHVKEAFPLYTYQSESDISSCPPTPSSHRGSSRNGARSISSVMSISGRSRSSIAGSEYSTAATNDQPRCQICLDYFISRVSHIRQLDCGHIFHPECIDEFLTQNSSLCPICKQCMLPPGYCPKITNAMVRRERALRRLRSTIHEEVDSVHHGKRTGRFLSKLSLHDLLPHSHSSDVPLTPIKAPKSTKEAAPRTPSATRLRRPTTSSTTDDTPSPESATREQPQADSISSPEPPQQQQSPSSEAAPTAESEDTVAALPKTQRRVRRHQSRPNQLRLKPAAANGGSPGNAWIGANKEPSDRTRARMKDLALLRGEDALPLADDEMALPMWKKVLVKVFPS